MPNFGTLLHEEKNGPVACYIRNRRAQTPGDDFAPHKPVSVSSRGRHFTLAYVKIFTYCGDSDFVDSATSKLMIRRSGQRAGEN